MPLSTQDALIYLMIVTASSDTALTDRELQRIEVEGLHQAERDRAFPEGSRHGPRLPVRFSRRARGRDDLGGLHVSPDIVGGVTTDEWAINVFRLCALNALDAQGHGAAIHLLRALRRQDTVRRESTRRT